MPGLDAPVESKFRAAPGALGSGIKRRRAGEHLFHDKKLMLSEQVRTFSL